MQFAPPFCVALRFPHFYSLESTRKERRMLEIRCSMDSVWTSLSRFSFSAIFSRFASEKFWHMDLQSFHDYSYFIDSIDQFWIWNCQKISKVLATSAGNQNYSINSYYSTKNYFPWKLENKWTRNSDRRRCGPQLHNQKCWKWNMNIFI